MNILVIGAAGKTGKLVVEQAVAAGHTVTAFVRNASHYHAAPKVRVLSGDATDTAQVSEALVGQDVVVDTVGGKTPWRTTELERMVAHAIARAAHKQGIKRIIAISALGVGDSTAHAPFLVGLLVLPTFLRGSTADKAAMEQEIQQAGVPYVLVRPAVLNDKPPVGTVRVLMGSEKARGVTRADVASFVIEQVTSDAYLNQAVTIANV